MKYIINNNSKLSIQACFERIDLVIQLGKISSYNGVYGYSCVQSFHDCFVNCNLTACGTHIFTITNQ